MGSPSTGRCTRRYAAGEVAAALADLRTFAATPGTLTGDPRTFQVWGGTAADLLADFPGIAAGQQGTQVARATAGPGGADLLGHELVVAGLLDLPEHADGGVPEVRRIQPGQRERVGRVGPVRVVRDQRVLIGRGVRFA